MKAWIPIVVGLAAASSPFVPAAAGGKGPAAGVTGSAAAPTQPGAAKESPFACNMLAFTPQERRRHFDELGPALRSRKIGVRELPDGYEFEFPADPATWRLLAEWTIQERECCPFFDLGLLLEREGGPLRLRLTGRPGTKAFIEEDARPWLQR